jgi:uncharacterized protein YgiB involved in biofilm formation
MKRSKKVALMLMVPTTTMMLASCGEDPTEAVVFNNPEECASMVSSTSADQCYADYRAAQALHPQVAPKYLNKSECENDFGSGQCEQAPQQHAGGSFFMPMMMGYMAGQMFNRQGGAMPNQPQQAERTAAGTGGAAAGAAANSRSAVRTQPLYKSRDDRGTFRTATNTPVARQTGSVMVRPSQIQPRAGQFAQRGGFGAQAAARNSYGG